MSTTSTRWCCYMHLGNPVAGFSTSVFAVGDQIFAGRDTTGFFNSTSGYNSTDHGFNFFTVTSYTNTNPAVVKFDMTGITTVPLLVLQKQLKVIMQQSLNLGDYPSFRTKRRIVLHNLKQVKDLQLKQEITL